jgi:hypothetical protein
MSARGGLTQAQIENLINQAVTAAQNNLQGQINQANQALADANQELQNARGQIAALQAIPPLQPQQPQIQVVQQPPPPPAPRVVQFSYTPGTAGAAAALIDYTTTAGAKIQKAAIDKLTIEFDLDKEHLYEFLEALRSRAIACGWYDTILMVNQAGINMNIVENYGTVTMATTRTKALTYMFSDTRQAQDSFNLYMCLEASLSTEARIAVYAESNTYTFQRGMVPGAVAGGDPNEQRRDGLMLLWTIVNRTTAMTTATISVLMEQLNNLNTTLNEANHDITAFNTKVRRLLTSYYANKRESYNETALLHNLARAYMSCKDEDFVRYIERKWSDHEDMTRELTSTDLMEFALKRYQTSLEQQTWGVDSKQTKTIMNLTAQVGTIRKWKKDTSKVGDEKSGSAGKSEKTEKKDFLPIDEWRKKQYREAPAWKKKAPKNMTDTKKVKGKTLHWCSHHKMWQNHKSDECRIIKGANSNNDGNKGAITQKKEDEKSSVRYSVNNMLAEANDSDDEY